MTSGPGPDGTGGSLGSDPDPYTSDRSALRPDQWESLPDPMIDELVVHVRRALGDLEDFQVTPDLQRLRAVPASKLRRGHGRRRLLRVLAAGGPLWAALQVRLQRDKGLWLRLQAASTDRGEADRATNPGRSDDAATRVADLEGERDRLASQRLAARAERDEAIRALAGAAGREQSVRAELESVGDQLAATRSTLAQAEAALAQAGDRLDQAVARERRRRDSRVADLSDQLAASRRQVDDLRRAAARRDAADRVEVTPRTSPPAGSPEVVDRDQPDDELRIGRPTRLPAGIRSDTREGVELLLSPGRRVLVDGYNVTRTHKDDVSLELQRRWLVDRLGGLVTSRKVEVTVVFDAHSADGSFPTRQRRGLEVVWSLPGQTADDDLVFRVAAAPVDQPLLVVTNDRELRERLALHRVDLMRTRELMWLLS